MLNHVYGLIGIAGTIITIVTSFMRNQSISQWLLICSGWLAALLIGWFTHRSIKIISQSHMEAIKSNNYVNHKLMAENKELIKELAHALEQKEKMEGIAAYLATQNPKINAMPRVTTRKNNSGLEGH